MKEQIEAPEKIQLINEETANLSDTEFKTLVIKMLQEITWYFNSIKKTQAAMKVALCEIKKNLQGSNSDRKETGTQINDLEQKEDRNFQPEQNEETRIQKNEERLRNLQDILKHSNIQIIGCQKEKRKSDKLKTYLKK